MRDNGLPSFHELYVVSDIHMGGEPGFQILKQGPRLAAFINTLIDVTPDKPVALVLNGDVIDSLAEPGIGGYVATVQAPAVLQRIYDDPAFKPVWDALAAFVMTENRQLIIAIGNHDIEIALPDAVRSITARLTGGDAHARARLIFANHGEGFACMVGKARVFCTHGNEVDKFNIVDHEQLSQLGNALNAGRDIDREAWVPNAGTRIVVDIMNTIKTLYPFIDLLKPETKAAVGVLAALDPGLVGRSLLKKELLKIAQAMQSGDRRVQELLSADELGHGPSTHTTQDVQNLMNSLLGPELKKGIQANQHNAVNVDDLLFETEQAIADGRAVADESANAEVQTLGFIDAAVAKFASWIGLVPESEALRLALIDWLDGDTTFDLNTEDETYKAVIERVGAEVDYVITGHTHLHRAIKFGPGQRRYYYNCGTWIRLLGFSTEVLNDSDAFEKLVKVLKSGKMSALDTAKIPGPDGKSVTLVKDRSTAVRLFVDGGKTCGQLLQVNWAAKKVSTQVIAGSEFVKH